MFCKYCGKVIADDSVFCFACGRNLSNAPAVPQVQTPVYHQPYITKKEYIAPKPQKKYSSVTKDGYFFKGIGIWGKAGIALLGICVVCFTAFVTSIAFWGEKIAAIFT
ncbi:MAG: zinc ribbon domain-containing protein [Firmicutes bacterium]|nr:zinc ribbon domain-containing protein [Bacillota bacterium]